MDDIWLLEMLRKKSKEERYPEYSRRKGMRNYYSEWDNPHKAYDESWNDYYVERHNDSEIYDVVNNLSHEDKQRMIKLLSGEDVEHFGKEQAKHIVSQMYHMCKDIKHAGEHFSYDKTTEIMQRYAGIIPHGVTPCDLYVALNAQYHDYVTLYKSWFGDNVESKIVESAIHFWFKDEDYKKGSKLFNYFVY